MRKRSVLIAALAAVGALGALGMPATAQPDDVNPYIVGGHDATEEYSFMVSLQQQDSHICGASLIKPDWAVTAAHCVQGGGDFTVRIGSNDHTTGGEEASVTNVQTHPSGDIAVLQLDHAVQATPINIASAAGDAGTATRIIGWGQTCAEPGCGPAPQTLQELDTQIVDDNTCQDIDGQGEICTDNPNGDSGACYGDSGGPQIKGTQGNWELIGATSRAGNNDSTCATGPSIYTDVTAYADWVNQNTGG
ncbi:S1 family peptidase [Saccharopolyspora sp. NPDC002376]